MPPSHPPKPDAPEPPKREPRSSPDLMTGVKSWLNEVGASRPFDAERLEARPCFSSDDVGLIACLTEWVLSDVVDSLLEIPIRENAA